MGCIHWPGPGHVPFPGKGWGCEPPQAESRLFPKGTKARTQTQELFPTECDAGLFQQV